MLKELLTTTVMWQLDIVSVMNMLSEMTVINVPKDTMDFQTVKVMPEKKIKIHKKYLKVRGKLAEL